MRPPFGDTTAASPDGQAHLIRLGEGFMSGDLACVIDAAGEHRSLQLCTGETVDPAGQTADRPRGHVRERL